VKNFSLTFLENFPLQPQFIVFCLIQNKRPRLLGRGLRFEFESDDWIVLRCSVFTSCRDCRSHGGAWGFESPRSCQKICLSARTSLGGHANPAALVPSTLSSCFHASMPFYSVECCFIAAADHLIFKTLLLFRAPRLLAQLNIGSRHSCADPVSCRRPCRIVSASADRWMDW
jgi:hypothetical protein